MRFGGLEPTTRFARLLALRTDSSQTDPSVAAGPRFVRLTRARSARLARAMSVATSSRGRAMVGGNFVDIAYGLENR